MLQGRRLPSERWTLQDHGLAVALLEYEADLCRSCGHPRVESMAAGVEKSGGNAPYYYEASSPPSRCHACDAIAMQVEAVQAQGYSRPQALQFAAVKKPRG